MRTVLSSSSAEISFDFSYVLPLNSAEMLLLDLIFSKYNFSNTQ
jgi:hypothetical protein